ncbi:MAG: hypothetical protein HOK28_23330, partial [Deltaproteobacteria bacterium]|nr:hypothetical protein [Deltaproteobacteria bacterium]
MVIAQRIVLLIMFHAVFWPTLSFAETKTLQPEAFIDLSKWNPDDGEFRLEGDWSHWPRQLLEDIEVGPQQRIDILSGAFVDEADHGNYLTHGVQLRGLPKALDYLSIRLGVIDTAHRLWAIDAYGNRRVISEAGTVGRTKEEAVPEVVWTHASLAGLRGPVLDLFLEVSGYRSAYIGVWRVPVIGLTKDLDKNKFNRLAFAYTLLGVLLMATIFHFVLFWLRPQDKVNLWFSLLCGGLALRH